MMRSQQEPGRGPELPCAPFEDLDSSCDAVTAGTRSEAGITLCTVDDLDSSRDAVTAGTRPKAGITLCTVDDLVGDDTKTAVLRCMW